MANPIDYYGDITLHGGALKNVAIEEVPTLPTENHVKGRIVLHDGKIKYYMGGKVGEDGWVVIGSSADVTALAGRVGTLETDMDTAEGNITTLQGNVTDLQNNKFDIANIVTSIATNVNDASDAKVPSEKAVKSAINTAISGAYKFAGTVANADALKSAEKVNGTIYNVTATFEFGGEIFEAGTNVVWDEQSNRWEPLSGVIDTSKFQLVDNLQASLDADATGTKYPNVTAVNAGLADKADKATTYTKTEVNSALSGKVDVTTVASGTFVKVTTNAQGLVTGGEPTITTTDISDFATKITSAEVATAGSLKTAQKFSITGGAEASEVSFDGTDAVALNVTKVSGGVVSGEIPVASVPEIGISKITDFANKVKGVIRPQFVDVKLNEGGKVVADGNKYTITTTGKAYGVMVMNGGVQVFVSTTVTDTNIVLDFNSAITPADFTVSYIQKF